MAATSYLAINQSSPGHYKITELSSNTQDTSAIATTLPKSHLQRSFPHITPATTTDPVLGHGIATFTWTGGPIEITGIVSIESLGVGFELLFNEDDSGSRVMGTFWGNLEQGVKVEVFDSRGSRTMRLDLEVREGKYIHADAERARWAKKRVVCTLPTPPSQPQPQSQI